MVTAAMNTPEEDHLDWREGRALRWLDELLGRESVTVPATSPGLSKPRDVLLRHGAARMARACGQWLVDEGGWRERRVLRGARRARGRAWDASLGAGFSLRCTNFSRDLWLRGAEVLPSLVGGRAGEHRAVRVRLRTLIPVEPTDCGDWIIGALAWRTLPRFRLPPAVEATMLEVLRTASPLVALMAPAPGAAAPLEACDALLRGPAARLVECGEDRLAGAWHDAALAAWRDGGSTAAARWNALASTMQGWCARCEAVARGDLLRPAARAFGAVFRGCFARGGEKVRGQLSRSSGLRSVSERDELLAAVAAFIEVGDGLLRVRDGLAVERYGDPRYDEAQVVLADIDELLGTMRPGIAGVGRALRGEVG